MNSSTRSIVLTQLPFTLNTFATPPSVVVKSNTYTLSLLSIPNNVGDLNLVSSLNSPLEPMDSINIDPGVLDLVITALSYLDNPAILYLYNVQ